MTFLNFAITFGILIVACNAACVLNVMKITNPREKPTGCFHEEEFHPFGKVWDESDCDECTCTKRGPSCCSQKRAAMGFNPKECVAYFMEENCSFKVTRKDNPNTPCAYNSVEVNENEDNKVDSENNSVSELEDWQNWDFHDYSRYLQHIPGNDSKKSESPENGKKG